MKLHYFSTNFNRHITVLFFVILCSAGLYFWYDKTITFDRHRNSNIDIKLPYLIDRKKPRLAKNGSFICDNSTVSYIVSSMNDSFEMYRISNLRPYCSIVPIPRQNWTKSRRYSERDVTFAIFTGSKFYHSRAMATRDTWLSRVTNFYFLGATPYSFLPVTVIEGAGETRLSNMKKIFYGLQIIYKHQLAKPYHERQKWFYIAGCDTFVNVQHVLKRLDPFDYTQPLLIGGHVGHETCLDAITGKSHPVTFPSGGAGFLFSAKLLELMQPHLSNYVEHVWPRGSESSDVALTCLASTLSVNVTQVAGFWAFPPDITLHQDGRASFHGDPEPNTYHYVPPNEMYTLDEFYLYQYVDRLVNDDNWLELTDFTRQFIASHYQLLRIKNKECKLPSI